MGSETIGGLAGLLIFRTVAELRNSGKSMKSLKIHQKAHNSAQFVRNNVKYMPVQHIWNLFQLFGLFSCLETLTLKHANNIPETTRHRLYCEKLGTSYVVAGFAICSFLEHIVVKEQMMTSFRKMLKMLVWSAQNQLITSEICPENKHKIGHFYRLLCSEVYPENSCKISWFFCKFVPKNPAKFDFFPRPIRSPGLGCCWMMSHCFTRIFLSFGVAKLL